MDEPQRPAELSEDAWQATPPKVLQFSALLMTRLAAIEARLNQNSQNSSKPPSSDPPSAPPRPAKTPRGKPKTKGAQPGHPDQQRDLLPIHKVSAVLPLRPTHCPTCQRPLPADLAPVGPRDANRSGGFRWPRPTLPNTSITPWSVRAVRRGRLRNGPRTCRQGRSVPGSWR